MAESLTWPTSVEAVQTGTFAWSRRHTWPVKARILSAGLQYSNAEVFEYVSKVARLYQQKRLMRLRTKPVVESPKQGGNSP